VIEWNQIWCWLDYLWLELYLHSPMGLHSVLMDNFTFSKLAYKWTYVIYVGIYFNKQSGTNLNVQQQKKTNNHIAFLIYEFTGMISGMRHSNVDVVRNVFVVVWLQDCDYFEWEVIQR